MLQFINNDQATFDNLRPKAVHRDHQLVQVPPSSSQNLQADRQHQTCYRGKPGSGFEVCRFPFHVNPV